MKKYKVVQVSNLEAFETSLNELAQTGWKIINSNLAFSPSGSNEPVYFALLESTPIEEELKHMMEENTDSLDNINNSLNNITLSPSAN